MSDEEGELNEALHASTNAESTTSDDTPWQMQDLHELISLQQVEEFTSTEIQHILALHAATEAMRSFYETYANTFQDIHNESLKRDRDTKTVPFSEEFYYSMPTPIEEVAIHVATKARELQRSNRFASYDFDRHTGPLSMARDHRYFIEPITEANKQKMVEFANDARARQNRYDVRREAFRNNTHPHIIQPQTTPLPIIQQRSSSSAEDDAERALMRSIQATGGSQTLLPQTPYRGNLPMLGNFTSMSSPGGGMGNFSYGGGNIPPNTQYTLQNTTSNSSSGSGGGSSAHDTRVFKPPFMATFSVETLDAFVNATITHLAASKHCPINLWIPMGTDTRANMYWQFFGRRLVTDEPDFNSLLDDAQRFVAVSKEYLQKSRAVKGVMSDTEAVKTLLKFKFNNPTNDSQNKFLTTQWVKFLQAHRELIDNPSGADQSGLVDTFIESNLTRVSKAQHFMFAHLRDMLPKPKTIKEAFQQCLYCFSIRHDTFNCPTFLQIFF